MKRSISLVRLLSILIAIVVLFAIDAFVTPILVVRGATLQIHDAQQAQTPIPTPLITPTPAPQAGLPGTNTRISISSQQFWLVVTVLAILAFLFWLQFWYSHRLQTTSYLAGIYSEAIEKYEINRTAAPFNAKWVHLDRNQWNDYDYDVYNSDWIVHNPEPTYPLSDDATPSIGTKGLALTPKQKEQLNEHEKWYQELHAKARARYDADLKGAAETAKEHLKGTTDVDLSVLNGQGPEFVLEFTTIVIIIFTVAILGILGILDNQQIGTILAAIAGYVLGRAVTSRSNDGNQQQTRT